MSYQRQFKAEFRHSDDGTIGLHITDALACLSSYTFGSELTISLSPEERDALIDAVSEEEAALTGDANTPWRIEDVETEPKFDEKNTEAMLDAD